MSKTVCRRRLLLLSAVVLATALPGAAVRARAQTSADAMQRGLGLLRSGEVAAAEAVFQRLVEQNPEHGPARLQLGRLALERGDLAEARSHLQIATTAEVRRPFMAWHLLGQAQLLDGQPKEATTSFDRALERAPRFAPSLLGRARAALRLGDVGSALELLERAQSLSPPPPEATLLLTESLVLEGRDQEAKAILDLASPEDGAGGGVGREAHMLLWALGGAEQDGQALRVALGENLHDARGLLALGLFELRAGHSEAASMPLRMALETDDQDPVAWLLLQRLPAPARPTSYPAPMPRLAPRMAEAERQLESGNAVAADEIASRILATRPFHAPAHTAVIRAAEASGELWRALAGYRQLMEWLPRVPTLEARTAQVARAMGALELAECLARRALRALPDDGSLHHLMGVIQADLGAHEVALEFSQRAITLGARDASVYQTLGRAHFERMEIGAAVAAYGKALELDPETAQALPRFALSSLNTPDLAALGDLLEACLEVHPEDENALYGLGLVRLRENDLDRARSLFEELATLTPEDSRVPYNLGSIFFRQGDRARGDSAMDRFRELKATEDREWLQGNRAHALRIEAQDASVAGDGEEAIRIYEEMAAAGTAKLEDYLAAGRLDLELARYRRAEGWFAGVLQTDPYQRDALGGLALAAEALGRSESARQARERYRLLSSPCSPPGTPELEPL